MAPSHARSIPKAGFCIGPCRESDNIKFAEISDARQCSVGTTGGNVDAVGLRATDEMQICRLSRLLRAHDHDNRSVAAVELASLNCSDLKRCAEEPAGKIDGVNEHIEKRKLLVVGLPVVAAKQ